jgi:undecaprenyl-diphosphatase
VSRSGATITAGLFMGLDRPAAARFSFLISIPAIVLAGLFELKKLLDGSEHQTTSAGSLILATLIAFVVGYASIAFLLRFLGKHSTVSFVIYRVVVGAIVLILTGAAVIS